MIKKILLQLTKGAVIGVNAGLLISLAFSYLLKLNEYVPAPLRFLNHFHNQTNAMLVSVIIWAVIGGVFSCTNLIFSEFDWSITKMTIVHFGITFFLFLPLALIAGWFPFSLFNISAFFVEFGIIYSIIWIISMLQTKKEINKINACLLK